MADAGLQDLIQDAFLRVWDQRPAVDGERLDALLWSTALNLAKNKITPQNGTGIF